MTLRSSSCPRDPGDDPCDQTCAACNEPFSDSESSPFCAFCRGDRVCCGICVRDAQVMVEGEPRCFTCAIEGLDCALAFPVQYDSDGRMRTDTASCETPGRML